MLENLLGWALISMGLGTLTEGYHVFRRRTERLDSAASYWWVAGAIWAMGLALIKWGLDIKGG